MVLVENQDYINKAMDILADRDTYRPITVDSTNKHKKKAFFGMDVSHSV